VWPCAPRLARGRRAGPLSDQSIIDGVDRIERSRAIWPGHETNHGRPEQVCGGFVASDGDGHGGDDDVVELKITGLI
jgi:hypothetical protein